MSIRRLDRANLQAFIGRICAIRTDTRPRWGRLTSAGLMAHLRYSIEVSLGEHDARDESNWFTRTIGRVLFFHWFTRWPGGVLKAKPGWTPFPRDDFDTERNALIDALERFVATAEREPDRVTISPLLGPLPLEYWRHIHGVHIAHHLRQFGQ
jgi:hypothetical protein